MAKVSLIIGAVLSSLFCVLAGPASASAPQSLVFTQAGHEFQYPVEQESPNYFFNNCGGFPDRAACDPSTWVGNPTNCAWDVDDYIDVTGRGTLDGSASGSLCVIADQYDNYSNDNHLIKVSVTAQSRELSVVLTSDQGGYLTATPVPNGGGSWAYPICTADRTLGPYPGIDGSNGGTGLAVTYTLTVSSAKKVNGVFAVLQAGNRQFGIC